MDSLDVLMEEKKLLFQEKLRLVSSIKQTITLLGVMLGLVLGAGYQYGRSQAFVALPFVLCFFAAHLLTNVHTFSIVCRYLELVDHTLHQEVPACFSLSQATVSREIRSRGLNMTRREGFWTVNPYLLVAFFTAILASGICIVSIAEGFRYLADVSGGFAAWLFLGGSTLSLLIAVLASVKYFASRNRVPEAMFSSITDDNGVLTRGGSQAQADT